MDLRSSLPGISWPAVLTGQAAQLLALQYQINWDGKVLGCCHNTWADFGANAFQDGLEPSVNSECIQYARQMLLGRAATREDVPCTSCDIYRGMRETGQWLRRDDAARGQRFTLEEALDIAAEWETSGRRADAISVYRRVLAARPGDAEATRRLDALGAGAT
jgi:hypothetical protein